MSVMFEPFFGVPQSVIRNGLWPKLSGCAKDLYVVLCHESERYMTRELTRTNAQLRELVGGAPNSFAKARTELMKSRLVQAEPFGAAGFVYLLCDPETGKPWHPDPRKRVRRRPQDPAVNWVPEDIPSGENRLKASSMNMAGTEFPFGANTVSGSENTSGASANASTGSTKGIKWNDIGSGW